MKVLNIPLSRGVAARAILRPRAPGNRRKRPTRWWLALALIVLVALAPAVPAGAGHLFGPESGWRRLRTPAAGRPLRVWSAPQLGLDLRPIIRPWNRLAGSRLFRITPLRRRADALIRPGGERSWTQCLPSYTARFRRCTVWAASTSTPTLRHELGHVLGFADHVPRSVFEQGAHASPRVCDDRRHPAFAKYRGVMSYCDWDAGYRQWFGRGDRRMLARAGYLRGADAGYLWGANAGYLWGADAPSLTPFAMRTGRGRTPRI